MRTAVLASIASLVYGSFVSTNGTNFVLNGAPFSYIGTNTYYLIYEDQRMLDDVFSRAAANNFTVLRTWAFLDIGYPNGTGR
jgi:mannan endo-1,4-beta-mannosidase